MSLYKYLLLWTDVVIQSSICSELQREKAELTLNTVPISDTKSRRTVASLLQQLQKEQQINVRIVLHVTQKLGQKSKIRPR